MYRGPIRQDDGWWADFLNIFFLQPVYRVPAEATDRSGPGVDAQAEVPVDTAASISVSKSQPPLSSPAHEHQQAETPSLKQIFAEAKDALDADHYREFLLIARSELTLQTSQEAPETDSAGSGAGPTTGRLFLKKDGKDVRTDITKEVVVSAQDPKTKAVPRGKAGRQRRRATTTVQKETDTAGRGQTAARESPSRRQPLVVKRIEPVGKTVLSDKEQRILELFLEGFSYRGIARKIPGSTTIDIQVAWNKAVGKLIRARSSSKGDKKLLERVIKTRAAQKAKRSQERRGAMRYPKSQSAERWKTFQKAKRRQESKESQE